MSPLDPSHSLLLSPLVNRPSFALSLPGGKAATRVAGVGCGRDALCEAGALGIERVRGGWGGLYTEHTARVLGRSLWSNEKRNANW
jgi:hypothetical protein